MVDTVIQLATEKLRAKEKTYIVVDDLMPRTVYSFNVSAYFLDSKAWGRPRRIDVETLFDGITYCTLFVIPPRASRSGGYAGDLTPQLFIWGILICISP